MLQKLHIKNYAIIDELTIDFDANFNVITGETGAGKSIILGALSLILGDRADTSVLINTDEKCIIEAYFHTADNIAVQQLLQREELEQDAQTIIRREINSAGKSRSFINDTPVNLQLLNELAVLLVDLHRQFDNHALKDDKFMYQVLDAMAGISDQTKQYTIQYKKYKQKQNELQAFLADQSIWKKEADYKQFLFTELEEANFKTDEIELLNEEVTKFSNINLITTTLEATTYALESSENAVLSELKKITQQLNSITNAYPTISPLAERLESSWIELKDIYQDIDALKSTIDLDPETLAQMQERLDLGYKLLKKHNVLTTQELLVIQGDLALELQQKNNADEHIAQLEKEIANIEKALRAEGDAIYTSRTATATPFGLEVNKLLHLVGMPNAVFKIECAPTEQLTEYGNSTIQFLIDTNKSGKFNPVQKTASGGELSRIMLSIKTLTAKAMSLPTLIFDEVDTGISGEAAKQVGILLKTLGAYHQIISITHQPQVAAKGDTHYYVYKKQQNDQFVKTMVAKLKEEDRVKAIAQMIGGDTLTEASLNNAKELIND